MIPAAQWAPSDGLTLEPNALLAAREVDRNISLTAGPGAGKTEMLAQRADFLLRTGTCFYPKRILAISFKVDASQNLKARVRKRCGADLSARLDSHTFHAFAKRIIDRFRVALTGRNALDANYAIGDARVGTHTITFNDLVPLALHIVETCAIARNAIRRTYSHVFLDEFQDCTEDQYRLVKACFHGSTAKLIAVGDTKQRIMGFAGAMEGIFLVYAADFNALALNLYQNFRSQMRLRRMQNGMILVMDPPAAVNEALLQGDAGEIEVARYDNDDEEAINLAESIQMWIEEEGVAPSEIAVLVSMWQRWYCQKLCAALELLGIPFRQEDASQNLASEPAASFVVDFLLVVTGSRDPRPHRRLLDTVVFSQAQDYEGEYRRRSQWSHLVANVRDRVQSGTLNLLDISALEALVDDAVAFVGREALNALSHDYAYGERLQHVIQEAVAHIHTLLEAGQPIARALASFSGDEAVRIMSIHKSKGLEFDTVIVLAVENQAFFNNNDADRSAYFVAISRAKRRLILTVASHRDRPNGARPTWRTIRSEQTEYLGYAEAYS